MLHIGGISFDLDFFLSYLLHPPTVIWQGLQITIIVAVLAQATGVVLGLIVALARLSNVFVLRWAAALYSWVWRGTPILVQLLIIYTGIAAAGIYRYPDLTIGPFTISGALQAAFIALSLNEAAYMGEIFRAAIQAIDRGQIDAARAIGMKPTTALRWVILPQAARIVIPPLGNDFTLMIKGTSLLSVIGVRELFGTIENINSATFKTFELYLVAAFWYLLLTSIMAIGQRAIEARLSRQDIAVGKADSTTRRMLFARKS
jgi:polar amino acid transport system permease protein